MITDEQKASLIAITRLAQIHEHVEALDPEDFEIAPENVIDELFEFVVSATEKLSTISLVLAARMSERRRAEALAHAADEIA